MVDFAIHELALDDRPHREEQQDAGGHGDDHLDRERGPEPGGNGASRASGVWGGFVVGPGLAAALAGVNGPVLLVDDLVSSRWTLTVAGRALRQTGVPAVLPFALAVDG